MNRHRIGRRAWIIGLIAFAAVLPASLAAAEMERITLSEDGNAFVQTPSGTPFTPWGFNYDHDGAGRLIEDYWHDEWDTVVEDFGEMRDLGANVVRIHIQYGQFMTAADTPNAASLNQLSRLLELAEQTGLYIDLTGLGCYHKQDVPEWYDAMSDDERWATQAVFWEAVAKTCTDSPAIFCYDLMNEPVVHGGKEKGTDWLGPGFGGKHFVQRITLEPSEDSRPETARQWIEHLVAAIRKHDEHHMITVGMVPWSLDRPGLTSGFVPQKVAGPLDFIAMHIYPESGKLDKALDTVRGFDIGKPIVIEETFPLKCRPEELSEFIDRSQPIADGWIGFYWGTTPAEYEDEETIAAAITLQWLELFQEKRKDMLGEE